MSSSKIETNIKYLKSQFIQNGKTNLIKSNLSTNSIITKIFKKFNKKYNVMPKRYNSTIIDNIVFNEKSHIVSKFKDLLINYDFNDFLKRYYTRSESAVRLPKYFEYYSLYSKIFPNYTSIPEGKYFYINIQKKQRMIDLQENIENEKSKEKKSKKPKKKEPDINVFNTSVINSILNRTNKEEMEMLFDIDFENISKEEINFIFKINKLVENINSYEIKEDYYIDYNYESKNEKKNNKKEIISPLMNININYINFNKYNNDVKLNSVSFNNQNNNKNNSFLNKLFNVQIKNSKRNLKNQVNNKILYKDGGTFLKKLNQIKQNRNTSNYLINVNNSKLSINKNILSSLGKNNSSNKIKLSQKNQTIAYEEKNKNRESGSNFKIEKSNQSLKNIFSYRTSFGFVSPNNNNSNNIELNQKFPLSSRNKNNDIDRDNGNLYLTNQKYFSKPPKKPLVKKSTLDSNKSNLYALINNSRNNKIILNNNQKLVPNNSTKFINFHNSISPLANKFKLKQKKKLKNNYSVLNNKFFDKTKLWNLENNSNNTILKENYLFNNFMNEKNKNINKNNNIFINKSNSIKSKKIYQNNSSRNLNSNQINKRINNKRDITGSYLNEFIKAFNNSKKLRNDFLSYREKEKYK